MAWGAKEALLAATAGMLTLTGCGEQAVETTTNQPKPITIGNISEIPYDHYVTTASNSFPIICAGSGLEVDGNFYFPRKQDGSIDQNGIILLVTAPGQKHSIKSADKKLMECKAYKPGTPDNELHDQEQQIVDLFPGAQVYLLVETVTPTPNK